MNIQGNALLPTGQVAADAGEARKAMSVWDGFIYNFLTMGVIFPWVYIWGPAAFPGANIRGALLLAFVVQAPISLAYCLLAAAKPVDAGDYVYQRQAFGEFGSVAVLSGFVVPILQWLGIAGWLFATLGLAPLFLSLGYFWHSVPLTYLGVICESPGGIFLISLALNFFTVLFLLRGLGYFARVQRVLFVLTLAAIAAMVYVLLHPGPIVTKNLNEFTLWAVRSLGLDLPVSSGSDLMTLIIQDAESHKYVVSPKPDFWSTLKIVPVAWTSLQWATYSVQQNNEISGANRFRNQIIMLLGSAAAVTGVLLLIAYAEQQSLKAEFLRASARGYWSKQSASPAVLLFTTRILQPFPNVFAMVAGGSALVSIVIGIGFLANALQIACNSFIGVSKILVRMSQDGILPSRLRLHEIDPKHDAPARAYWAYFLLGLPVIFGFSLCPLWSEYTLGVTFACGCVFLFTALAATRVPTRFSQDLSQSDVATFPQWRFKVAGYVGAAFAALMVGAYLVIPSLGMRPGVVPFTVGLGVILICALIVYLSRIWAVRMGPEEVTRNFGIDAS